jgi:hypothetical protein
VVGPWRLTADGSLLAAAMRCSELISGYCDVFKRRYYVCIKTPIGK